MKNPKKVMVLDDEPIVCERLKPALERAGFEVETCTQSRQTLQRLSQQHFDVLITDLKMHKPDGLDVMRFVRQYHPATKVIIITGFATADTAREALQNGAVDFVAKPFKISRLRDIVIEITSTSTGNSWPARHGRRFRRSCGRPLSPERPSRSP